MQGFERRRGDQVAGLGSEDPHHGEVGRVGGFEIGGSGYAGRAGRFPVGACALLEPGGEALGRVLNGDPCLTSPGTGLQHQEGRGGNAGQGVRGEVILMHSCIHVYMPT